MVFIMMPENKKFTLDFTDAVSVWMHQPDLSIAPVYPLPEGYRMRFYAEGDVQTWLDIQRAADPQATLGEANFHTSFPDEDRLAERVMFLVNPAGKDIGSITAWDDDQLMGREMGLIHWVALIPEAQALGLSKPLLSAAIEIFNRLNYTEAWLETSTARIPAINLYLHFGFKPYIREDKEREGWRAVAPKLKFPIDL